MNETNDHYESLSELLNGIDSKEYTSITYKNPNNIDEQNPLDLSFQYKPSKDFLPYPIHPSPIQTSKESEAKTHQQSPYIGLKAKISRAYANYHVVILLILLLHLYLSLTQINYINAIAKRELTSSCLKAENAANLLTASPKALLKSARNAALATANTATHVTGKIISASVHILNLVVVWVIHRYTKLIVCVFDTVAGVLLDVIKAFSGSKTKLNI